MKFTKLALGLSLTAAFGLMACGDDSSNSPDASQYENMTPTCTVTSSGNTAGYTMSVGPVSTKFSATLNKDGSVSYTFSETFPSNTFTAAELKAECAKAKAEAEADGVEFSCKDNGITGSWTEEADEDEDPASLEELKETAQFVCDVYNGKTPSYGDDDDDEDEDDGDSEDSSSSSADDDDDSESTGSAEDDGDGDDDAVDVDDEDESTSEEEEDDSYKSSSCDISKNSDKWTVSYTSADVTSIKEYVFEGSTMTLTLKTTTPVSDCEMYAEATPAGMTFSCKDGVLTTTYDSEATENADKDAMYASVKADCAALDALAED